MSKFVFQLAGVLRHRERTEKDRQRDLAVAEAEMVRLQSELHAMNDQIRQSIETVRTGLVGRLDMNDLAAHRRYLLGLQRKSFAVTEQIKRQQDVVRATRLALVEAARQRKVLEKLEERQRRQWKAAMDRREARELDELTTQLGFRALTAHREGG